MIWILKNGCFIIYPYHNGFVGPQLLSNLKIPSHYKQGDEIILGGAQRDSPKKKNNKQVNLRGGSGEIKKKYQEFIKKTIVMITEKFNDIIHQLFTKFTTSQDTKQQKITLQNRSM